MKRLVMVMIALGLIVSGCGGNKPSGEADTSPATMDTDASMADDDAGSTDDADRDLPTSTDLEDYAFKTIHFDFDKYTLRNDAKAALEANADILRNNASVNIVIEGHCDERGTDEYNLALGERRARAARDYLTRLGIDASRVSIMSFGEERPVALGHDEESWRMNRRSEFEPK